MQAKIRAAAALFTVLCCGCNQQRLTPDSCVVHMSSTFAGTGSAQGQITVAKNGAPCGIAFVMNGPSGGGFGLALAVLALSSIRFRILAELPALRLLVVCRRNSLEVFALGTMLAMICRLASGTFGVTWGDTATGQWDRSWADDRTGGSAGAYAPSGPQAGRGGLTSTSGVRDKITGAYICCIALWRVPGLRSPAAKMRSRRADAGGRRATAIHQNT